MAASNLPPNQDPASIYYIHPSDANAIQLVSYKFNGEGFSSWKRSMLLTLSAKNKLGFVNGTISKPTAGTIEGKAWERCNDLVCSLILYNLDESIAKSVMFLKSAEEIWTDLDERFGYASMAQIYSLEQKLVDISQGDKSVSEFFTDIKSVWDEIEEAHPLPYCTCNNCTCNLTKKIFQRQQEKMVLQFMMKLNDQFATIRGNILMMQALPKVTEAF
uniref:Retrotransposon Copia-like N-terminal domain-containing protein n=1 Tax=Chenopodium quinoa TaxID=63459 RepID=A0A803KXL5_CHEQI